MTHERYVADVSLALINRTGAYHVCRDIVEQLPEFFISKRYWRLTLEHEPQGLTRKLLGRAMIFELQHLRAARRWLGPRRRRPATEGRVLYLDPLYVLQARLEPRDIVLCHDIGPLTHPYLYSPDTTALYAEAYASIKAAAPGMVFVSHATRREFERVIGSQVRFSRVIPLYVRSTLAQCGETPPPRVSTPFLLTVGALETRKNHVRIIEAFLRSGLREQGYTYVFCGPRGNSVGEVLTLARTTPGVINLEYISDAEVHWLYRHASGFVLPSLLEGFGLPALEAGQYGLVSLVSRNAAQVEAVGDAAIQVDPMNVDEIAEGLRRLVDMTPVERSGRVAKAREHAAALTQERFLNEWAILLVSQE